MKTGIPLPERLVARLLIGRWRRKHPPEATVGLVRGQQRLLEGLIDLAGERATERVQIRRLPGLEASSTNYSLAMVADHLARTNRDMAATIAALAAGRDPGIDVVIGKYKPDPGVSAERAKAELDRSIADLEAALSDIPAIRRATGTLEHPWFGALTAATWACFPSFHQALHLEQARMIGAGLAREGAPRGEGVPSGP